MTPKVLIVDDEPDLVRTLRMRFQSKGYVVVTAADGMQATAVAIKECPDLIVLDIGMPCGDGFTVVERLRGASKTQFIPIVILTARRSIADTARAMELKVDRYLTKPFDPQELLEIAGKLTGRAA